MLPPSPCAGGCFGPTWGAKSGRGLRLLLAFGTGTALTPLELPLAVLFSLAVRQSYRTPVTVSAAPGS
jgi:hypothetical protein